MNAVIDGAYVLHRSMHLPGANSGVTGVPVGAVQTSIKSLVSIVKHHSQQMPRRIFWIHDKAAHPERLALYPAYKQRNHKTAEEVEEHRQYREIYSGQKAILLSLLPHFGVHVVDGPYEGDDSIWYLTQLLSAAGESSTIFTSDRDFLQLLSPLVSVYHMDRNLLVGQDNWRDVSGWSPSEIVLAKAILGDKSDNIPSPCHGLGKVGLRKLFESSGKSTLHGLAEHAAQLGGKYAVLADPAVQQQIGVNVRLILLGMTGFESDTEKRVIESEVMSASQFDLQGLVCLLNRYGMHDASRFMATCAHLFGVLK